MWECIVVYWQMHRTKISQQRFCSLTTLYEAQEHSHFAAAVMTRPRADSDGVLRSKLFLLNIWFWNSSFVFINISVNTPFQRQRLMCASNFAFTIPTSGKGEALSFSPSSLSEGKFFATDKREGEISQISSCFPILASHIGNFRFPPT